MFSSVTILVSTKLTTVTPSIVSRRRWRREACDIGKLLSVVGPRRAAQRTGPSGGVRHRRRVPTETLAPTRLTTTPPRIKGQVLAHAIPGPVRLTPRGPLA